MQDLFDKFSKLDVLVAYLFTDRFATAKGCLPVFRHLGLMSCNAQAKYITSIAGLLAETYAKYVSNEKSDISGRGELLDARKIVVRKSNYLRAKKQTKSWKAPTGLFTVHIIALYITHFLLSMF